MGEHEQKLNILFLITKSNVGGAQRYVYDLSTRLSSLGHRVTVAFGGNGILGQKLSREGIKTIEIESLGRDMRLLADLMSFIRLLSIIRDESPDVVHLNSSKMGGIGALAARVTNGAIHINRMLGGSKKPIRIIFTGHGWALNEERPDWQRALIALAHWLTIQLAHETIAVSKTTKEEVAQIPYTKHKLSVVHNGIGVFETLSREDALDKMLGRESREALPENTLIIGTIGELHKNKGHSYALEALAQLKKQSKTPVRFIIIGDGEEREKLVTICSTLNLSEEVIFHSNTNAKEMLAGFDIFLFPSIKEGFPYAVLEAGNVGLPIIATAVGGIPEVIDDMHSGILIQSKNPGEITRSLQYLVENKERRAEFGKAIKERIEGRFNIDNMTKETLARYFGNV